MTLRIAYVLGITQGGTGRHVAMLARGCARAADVRVLGPASVRSMLESTASFDAITITDRPRPARDLAAVARLRRLLGAMAPDVVHAHGLRAGALAVLALRPFGTARWSAGRPPALVVTVHNAAPHAAWAAAVHAVLERLVARRADVVLCVSADLSARMRGLGAREVGRAVVPAPCPDQSPGAGHRPSVAGSAGLPGPATGEIASAPSAPDERPVVLAVGRLAPQKGFDTLISAAARWRERRPEPLVVIAGSGPLAAALAEQARELEVDARFLGWRDDIDALLTAAAVFVLPSRWEGQPLIVQQALRAGRPIVAADVGGVRELTGDDAALLIRAGDPAGLGAAVLRVLDDPEMAAALGQAATARAASLPGEADAITAALALYGRLSDG